MDFFSSRVHLWYSLNKRDLPWRNTCDPYFIWLSEIILQQTRIDQGLSYYLKFTGEFPTIFELANADEDQILKLWQGLGYYSRARNLHFTAKYIAERRFGKFPDQYEAIRSLKGIGDYTAAAIASISFKLEYPAIDGNVYRTLSRFFGIDDPIDSNAGKKVFRQLAGELIRGNDPGMHNQALMEFGALQCTPQKPDCIQCPLNEQCVAFNSGKVALFPVKSKKKPTRERYFNYFVLRSGHQICLKKRTGNDIWKNLYEFPLIEINHQCTENDLFGLPETTHLIHSDQILVEKITDWKLHLLTHQRIHYRFIVLHLSGETKFRDDLILVNEKDIFNFAVPKLIETFISKVLFSEI